MFVVPRQSSTFGTPKEGLGFTSLRPSVLNINTWENFSPWQKEDHQDTHREMWKLRDVERPGDTGKKKSRIIIIINLIITNKVRVQARYLGGGTAMLYYLCIFDQ